MRRSAPVFAAAAIAAVLGCEERDDLDGQRRRPPGLESREESYALPIGDKRAVHDLVDNRLALVAHRRGFVLVECGLPSFATHLDGGGWQLGAVVDGVRAAVVSGRGADLYIPIDGDPGGVARGDADEVTIHLRARPATSDQLASVFLNGERLGDVRMPHARWEDYAIEAPAETVRDGDNRLRLYFRHADRLAGIESAAAVARVAIGPPGRKPPGGVGLTAGPSAQGGERLQALSVPAATRLSHYTLIPAGAPELAVAVAGDGAEVEVRVAPREGPARTLWTGRAGDGWTPTRIDLDDVAGEVARIDLASDGPATWGHPQIIASPPEERGGEAAPPADHVIVWVVSGLRPDRALDPARAPAMAAFAGRSVRAEIARATAPAPAAGHAAILTGAAPDASAVDAVRIAPSDQPLAQRFREAGFATVLVSGDGSIREDRGFARGAEVYDNPRRAFRDHGAPVLWRRAREVLEANADGHVFAYVASEEPDLPYDPSDTSLAAEWPGAAPPMHHDLEALAAAVRAGRRRLGERQQRYVEALYDASVRDADRAFAAMLADLSELGIAERTAVILVADHGQALFEHGAFGRPPALHEEMTRVPLAVHAPGGAPGAIPGAVHTADVYATALAAAGIAPPPGTASRNLLALARGADPTPPRPLRLRLPGRGRALVIGRHKLVVPESGPHTVFDLADDPSEQRDRAGESPIAERALRGVFGLAITFEPWNARRWGSSNDTRAAFPADVGG